MHYFACLVSSPPTLLSLSYVRAYGSSPGRTAPVYLWSCLYLLTVSGNQGNWSQSLLWWQQWKRLCPSPSAHMNTSLCQPPPCSAHVMPVTWLPGKQLSNHNQTFIFNRFKSTTWLLRRARHWEVPLWSFTMCLWHFKKHKSFLQSTTLTWLITFLSQNEKDYSFDWFLNSITMPHRGYR